MKKSVNLNINTISGDVSIGGGFSIPGALKKLNQLIAANTKLPYPRNSDDKAKLALEAGIFYRDELSPRMRDLQGMNPADIATAVGLNAADNTDPSVGTLSGTLIMLQSLTLFAYDYPELAAMYTDFSAEPGQLNQATDTRIIAIPSVQKYNSTKDAAGRPEGWSTVSPAIAQDVPITLTDYIGVPIVFGQDLVSSTVRDLFAEQAPAAMKAIAGYFVGMMTALIKPVNFQAYAEVTTDNPQSVPVAYTTYVKDAQDFSMTDLDKLSAIFTQNKVPRKQRGILLSPQYYARLRSDPRLEFLFAAAKGDPQLTEQTLPQGLSGFFPYEAPYLPSAGNLAFFPFHKAAIVLKSRLPQNFTKGAFNAPVPGDVTTVTDPDTKLSVALVQYVNLTQNYAEWRPEVILGAGIGDARGGLCGTSQ